MAGKNRRAAGCLMRLVFSSVFLLLLTGFSFMAQAYDGVTRTAVMLRAGPWGDYPVVLFLDRRAPVKINGCLADWQWCEVENNDIHGWVPARYIGVMDNSRGAPVRMSGGGPRAGIPFINYERDAYWERYYRDRDFYRQLYRDHRGKGGQPYHGH